MDDGRPDGAGDEGGRPAPAARDEGEPLVVRLRNLAALRDEGVLSDGEFDAAKRRLLEDG